LLVSATFYFCVVFKLHDILRHVGDYFYGFKVSIKFGYFHVILMAFITSPPKTNDLEFVGKGFMLHDDFHFITYNDQDNDESPSNTFSI